MEDTTSHSESPSDAAAVATTTAPDETKSQPVESSVMARVAQKKRARRGRGKPPGWTVWVANQAGQSRTFFSHTLPIWLLERRQQMVTVAVSLVAHLLLAMLLAMWVLPPSTGDSFFDLIVSSIAQPTEEDLQPLEIEDVVQPDDIQDLDVNSNMKQLLANLEGGDASDQITDVVDQDFSLDLEPTDAEMEAVFKKGEFGGRSEAGKRAALKKFGGTADSEKAVASGLRWLKQIQQEDGSWSFAKQGPGARAGGFRRTEVGATSLALLCYLGAGHTHTKGPYRETVEKGLAYIGSQADVSQGAADLRGRAEGNSGMYVQGLATICISEAHALERGDRDLKKLTEMAVNFIEKAQHPITGGWRYKPRDDTSDTSVVGWQIMAIQSAKSGGVRIDTKALRNARNFLNSAQTDDSGAYYSYVPGGTRTKTMTAVGLLCRMYLGWRKDNDSLKQGVEYLASQRPDKNNIYYNYYATQVIHHWGGDPWKKWNQQMREQLVRTQVQEGPAAGSWPMTDPHGGTGGQLYQTALSILTLEVYYRHLPIYRRLDEGSGDPATVKSDK